MARDQKARDVGHLSVIAIGNMMAALVDTMRVANVPGEIVREFLDRLETLNAISLWGTPGDMLSDLVDAIRRALPCNDE